MPPCSRTRSRGRGRAGAQHEREPDERNAERRSHGPSIGQTSGVASRSVSSRNAAAASAARDRPIGPSWKTTRLTRRSPAPVDTTIETAVSLPRGRARMATPTSAPPSLAHPSRELDQVAAGRVRSLVGVGRLVRTGYGCVRIDDLAEPEPLGVPEQGREAAAGADLDGGQGPAELGQPRADRLAPGGLAGRPDIGPQLVERRGRRLVHELLGRTWRSGDGRDPQVDGFGPGIGGDDRVGRTEQPLAEQVGHLGLADPGQPVGSRGDLGPDARSNGAAEPRGRPTSVASRAAAPAAPR